MRFFSGYSFVTFGLLLCGTSGAIASCFECDDVVDLNQSYADCYVEQFDSVVEEISSSKDGFVRVNLGACTGDTTDGDRSITSMPIPGSTDKSKLKSVYIFDMSNAECLKKQLDTYEGTINPSVTFELYRLCAE